MKKCDFCTAYRPMTNNCLGCFDDCDDAIKLFTEYLKSQTTNTRTVNVNKRVSKNSQSHNYNHQSKKKKR